MLRRYSRRIAKRAERAVPVTEYVNEFIRAEGLTPRRLRRGMLIVGKPMK